MYCYDILSVCYTIHRFLLQRYVSFLSSTMISVINNYDFDHNGKKVTFKSHC